MNTAYYNLIRVQVEAAVAAARAFTNVRHRGLKGTLREIVIRELFRPLLPGDIGVGTGEIISYDNRHSGQQDIVIYDKRIIPPLLLEGATGLFPIESVLYTVEVKSILKAKELKASHKSAIQLRDFPYLAGEYDEFDRGIPSEVKNVISTLLAFDTDLTSSRSSDIKRYIKLCGVSDPALRVICVVGKGCWAWRNGHWDPWPGKEPLDEVVGFVTTIMNSYREIAATRKWPRMGIYLLDE